MKNFLNLLKKDIKEIITPQLLVPLVIVVIFYGLIGNVMQTETKKASSPQPVLVVDYDKSTISSQFIENLKSVALPEVYYGGFVPPIAYAEMRKIDVVIEIPPGFEESIKAFKQPQMKVYSLIRGISVMSVSQPAKVKTVISAVSETLSNMYIKNFTNIDPAIIKNPIALKEYVVVNGKLGNASPEMVSNLLMSQVIFVPIILAFVIIFASQMIVSLIASEKENKTLETLMTVPVRRPFIILSKMLASSIMALIISAFYLVGMRSYFNGISMGEFSTAQGSSLLKALGLVYTPVQYFYIGLLLFLTIVASLALASILAVFAEDTKSAQMYLTPLMILIMIPYFLSLFTNIDTLSIPLKILVYLIPFSYPFIASQKILFGSTSIVYIGVLYLLLFSSIAIVVATRIVSSDRIFTTKVKRMKISLLGK
ncbi:ABC transporter permease [Caldisericum exile]|uniref:ABC transporter permease protein n=1 Tax=Caldisericum exile (strain DSM 21853 / NBRC 104410 / AZM16c01) TaxID=511051 RepID=A0A7U6GDM9_CALEA|nr:ABC transporter permease [Caldisericum exile]BAL80490.1 putative ABC transporter permease protein [Caldisericum exile AZM16c01]